jgi:hypothetical protein
VVRDVQRAHQPRGAGVPSCVGVSPGTLHVHVSAGTLTFMSPPAPSTFMPPPATVDPIAATKLPPGLANGKEVVEVEPPLTRSSDRLGAEVPFCSRRRRFDGRMLAFKFHIRKPIRIW